jgi:hypothetical protein
MVSWAQLRWDQNWQANGVVPPYHQIPGLTNQNQLLTNQNLTNQNQILLNLNQNLTNANQNLATQIQLLTTQHSPILTIAEAMLHTAMKGLNRF